MPKFQLSLVPCTRSPVIRNMHRQTRTIEAANERDAKRLVQEAFPDGADLSGEWFVETLVPLNRLATDHETEAPF